MQRRIDDDVGLDIIEARAAEPLLLELLLLDVAALTESESTPREVAAMAFISLFVWRERRNAREKKKNRSLSFFLDLVSAFKKRKKRKKLH